MFSDLHGSPPCHGGSERQRGGNRESEEKREFPGLFRRRLRPTDDCIDPSLRLWLRNAALVHYQLAEIGTIVR